LSVFAVSGLLAGPSSATFRGRNGLIAFLSDANDKAGRERHAIWVVSPNGRGARRVTPGARPPADETDYSVVFFPDGRHFAYISQVYDSEFTVENQIYVKAISAPADAVGSPVLPAPVDYRLLSLGISPDGRRLVLAAEPPPLEETQLFTIRLDGTGMKRITSGPLEAVGPDFSPDGRTIVFTRRGRHHGGIFTIGTNGAHLRKLTSRPSDGAPCFSPSGHRIVFNRRSSRKIRIYSMRADGSGVRRLTDGPYFDRGPVFSPDGRSIAFSRSRLGRNPDIYVMRADGSGTHLAYRSRGRLYTDFGPDWGPKPR
jgi:Tol biopolymer transport system component